MARSENATKLYNIPGAALDITSCLDRVRQAYGKLQQRYLTHRQIARRMHCTPTALLPALRLAVSRGFVTAYKNRCNTTPDGRFNMVTEYCNPLDASTLDPNAWDFTTDQGAGVRCIDRHYTALKAANSPLA